jgi:hypothetical protein
MVISTITVRRNLLYSTVLLRYSLPLDYFLPSDLTFYFYLTSHSLVLPSFVSLYSPSFSRPQLLNWCCDITVDSTTPAPINDACTERWISKQMQHIMLVFHNCSRYKPGLLQKGCIYFLFYTFRSKQTRLKSDAVTKKCLLNCSPF